MWREYQLEKSTSRPGHGAAKFGTGDSRTLRDAPAAAGVDVRAALLAFHAQHYSASRMALVVCGREGLDELEGMVSERFAAIKNNDSKMPFDTAHPWGGGDGSLAGLQQWCVPVKDTRTLTLSWAMPPARPQFASKPERYLSHLMGHEGPGSILSCLKGRGLATELSAGTFDGEAGYSTFSVSATLTEAGLERSDEVASIVYAYVGLLRAHGPLKWVHDELAGQGAVSFRFRSMSRPLSTATRLAHALQEYPTAHAVSGGHLVTAWDPEAVAGLLALMIPANSRMRISAKGVAEKCDRTEQWYGVKYGQAPFSAQQTERWAASASGYEALTRARVGGGDMDGEVDGVDAWASSLAPALHLPSPNEFLASDFTLKHPALAAKSVAPAEEAAAESGGASPKRAGPREPVPVLLRDNAVSTVWHHGDSHFAVPKAYLHAELALPGAYTSPRAIVLTDLAVRLLKESLNELAYAAEIAELAYTASPTVKGLALSVGGFSHRLPVLAARIGERIAGLTFTDAQFAIQLDKAVRELANHAYTQPYSLAAYDASVATTVPKWHIDERRAAIAHVTAEALRAFISGSLLAHAHVTAFVSGNASPEDALTIVDGMFGPVAAVSQPPFAGQLAGPRVVALPAPVPLGAGPVLAWEYVYSQPPRNPGDPNAAMDMLLQVGPQAAGGGVSQNALLDLAVHVAAEPYFDTLRTKQALGYIVFATHKHEGGVEWARFLVQSNKVPAGELITRTEAFLRAFVGSLEAMPPAKFASNVEAVVSKKLEADKSLQVSHRRMRRRAIISSSNFGLTDLRLEPSCYSLQCARHLTSRSYPCMQEEASRLWGEIRDGTLDFTRSSQEIAALRALTHPQFVAWFKAVIAPGGARRRFFASLVEAGSGEGGSAPMPQGEDGEDEEEGNEEEEELPAEEDTETPHAGEPAPSGGEGGLAREDRLAPTGEGEAKDGEAPTPSSAAADAQVASLSARTLTVSAAQAAAVQHAVATHGHVAFPSAEGDAVVQAAFAGAGVDIAPQLAAAVETGLPLHVRVAVSGVATLRALLPLHLDVGAVRAAAWKAAAKV